MMLYGPRRGWGRPLFKPSFAILLDTAELPPRDTRRLFPLPLRARAGRPPLGAGAGYPPACIGAASSTYCKERSLTIEMESLRIMGREWAGPRIGTPHTGLRTHERFRRSRSRSI